MSKEAPPIPTVLWGQVLAVKSPKKARKWVVRWLERNGASVVYAEGELFEKLRRKVEAMASRSGGNAQ